MATSTIGTVYVLIDPRDHTPRIKAWVDEVVAVSVSWWSQSLRSLARDTLAFMDRLAL